MSQTPKRQDQPESAPLSPPATYEQAVQALERIIERIESGEIGLEQSIAEYERGVGLIRRCREVLDRAEQRVEELTSQMQSGVPTNPPPGKGSATAPESPF